MHANVLFCANIDTNLFFYTLRHHVIQGVETPWCNIKFRGYIELYVACTDIVLQRLLVDIHPWMLKQFLYPRRYKGHRVILFTSSEDILNCMLHVLILSCRGSWSIFILEFWNNLYPRRYHVILITSAEDILSCMLHALIISSRGSSLATIKNHAQIYNCYD